MRFGVLRQGIPNISQRMLTLTLRNLERDGLVSRHYYPELPPRVEYELTERGCSMLEPLAGFYPLDSRHMAGYRKPTRL